MIDLFNDNSWKHLVISFEKLTDQQKDSVYLYHASTGGDMIYLNNGEVIYV